MPVAFLAALAAAIAAITAVQTWAAYPSLPLRVPVGLDAYGYPRSMAPRPVIWLIVVVQLCILVLMAYGDYAIATHAPGTHGSLLGASIIAAAVMALMWRVQMLLLSSAKSDGNPVPMNGFWIFLAAFMAIVALDVIVIR